MKSALAILFWFLLACFSSSAQTDSASQTSWSGETGIQGSVSLWSDDFWAGETVATISIAGQLALSSAFLAQPVMTTVCDPCQEANAVAGGDMDSDGDIDLVAKSHNDQLYWYENLDGDGLLWESIFISTVDFPMMCAVADLDGDGHNDVLVSSVVSAIIWLRNIDGSGHVWTALELPGPNSSKNVLPMDIDWDGDIDILTTQADIPESICVGTYTNLSGEVPGWLWEVAACWSQMGQVYIAVADMDADGDLDVAASMYDASAPPSYPGQLWWCENLDGLGGSWMSHLVSPSWQRASGTFAADIDGDGDGDMGCVSVVYSDLSWWENTDAPVAWPRHPIASVVEPVEGGAADLNGDGDIDVFCTSDQGTIVYENVVGTGELWTPHTLNDMPSSRSTSLDIDLDGDLDLAVVSTFPTHNLEWWRLTEFVPSGYLESTILDTGCDPQWASIDWNALEPSGTDLSIQYRSSGDPGNLGAWSDPLQTPCNLSGMLSRYFQYRVNFLTTDPASSPVLFDITLNWDPTGLEYPEPSLSLALLVSPSPTSGQVQIDLPAGMQGEVQVIDLSGRVVATLEASGSGESLIWDCSGSPAGVYTVRLHSGAWSSSAKVVVLH